MRCAALERSCVKANEVVAWIRVAPSTNPMMGSRRLPLWLVSTPSTKGFEAAGKARPQKRLMIISTKPSASSPRRGRISRHACGHASTSLGLGGGLASRARLALRTEVVRSALLAKLLGRMLCMGWPLGPCAPRRNKRAHAQQNKNQAQHTGGRLHLGRQLVYRERSDFDVFIRRL